MKTRGWLVAAILNLALPVSVIAQCGGTIRTISYDTVIIGVGANEDPYTFTFPLFNADSGTLMDVAVSSAVTLNYSYDVENTDTVPKTFRHKVTRSDDLISDLLPGGAAGYTRTFPNSINNPQNSTNYYSHLITATDNVLGSGTDYADSSLALLNNTTIINVSANPVDFLGVGNASMDYYSAMNFNVNMGALFNTVISDHITLTVTYTYCDNINLGTLPGRVRPDRDLEEIKRHISPNPSHTGNFKIHFGSKTRSDWQVEVFTMNGHLISRKLFYNALDATVNNGKDLSQGVYIVRATNLKSHENFVERLLVK